jgi:hypothetical protein
LTILEDWKSIASLILKLVFAAFCVGLSVPTGSGSITTRSNVTRFFVAHSVIVSNRFLM